MNETVLLFIGADNETGLLDLPRIEAVIAKHHDGFTTWTASGHWQGAQEDSAVIMVSGNSVTDTVTDLKTELRQDAIGILTLPAMRFA